MSWYDKCVQHLLLTLAEFGLSFIWELVYTIAWLTQKDMRSLHVQGQTRVPFLKGTRLMEGDIGMPGADWSH